jgi:outer membrane protein TolC
VDLQAAASHRRYDIDGLSLDGPYWSASLVLPFPVFDGLRTPGHMAQARSDLRTLEIDGVQLRDEVALEVRTAPNAVEEARGVESAQVGLLQVESNLAGARRDRMVAAVMLQRVLGIPP